METLNKSEKNVLTLLEQNCRTPANQIAKRLRLSPEGVLKIIKRLENSGVITRFNTKYSYSKMGYKLFPVHIKLTKLNKEIIARIKSSIIKHKSCAWYMFCEGEYDLLLSFKIASHKDTQDMNELLRDIADYTHEKELSVVLYSFEISKSFIHENQTRKLFQTFDYENEPAILSKEETKILEILKSNSRETVLNISEKVHLSARVISSKIKKLEKENIISGFKTKINTAILGFQPCIALIALNKHDETDLLRFVTYCQNKPGINYLVRQEGKYDIELTIEVQNTNEFYEVMDELREQFQFIKKMTNLISKESS